MAKKKKKKYRQKYTTGGRLGTGTGIGTGTGTGTETGETPITGTQEQFDEERAKRITQTGRTAQEMAKGNVNLDTQAVIPRPEAIDRTDTIIEQGVGQMTDPLQTAGAQQVNVGTEQVSTGDVTRATTPQERGPAQITQDELTLVPEQAQVDTAQGQVSRETTDVDVDRVGDLYCNNR
jgi:hypothetical protein